MSFLYAAGNQGYVHDPAAIEAFVAKGGGQVMQAVVMQALADSGKGKDYFAFEIERELMGGVVRPPHWQGIGDCVSHGITGAAEDLQWLQRKKNGRFIFKWLASEGIYGLGRVEIGRGQLGGGDGLVVAWGMEAAMKFGFLPREVIGKYDLRIYRASLAKQWGRYGLPDELEPIARQFPIKEAHLLQGPNFYEQARDAMASGATIVDGSNWLYRDTRDKQGFCLPGQSGGHSVYFRGFVDAPKRPGMAYQQSWGPGIPSQGEQRITLESGREVVLPPGCFLIDAENFDKMHRRDAELWALISEEGFTK
jgi:hypothetical protein